MGRRIGATLTRFLPNLPRGEKACPNSVPWGRSIPTMPNNLIFYEEFPNGSGYHALYKKSLYAGIFRLEIIKTAKKIEKFRKGEQKAERRKREKIL